MAEATKTRKVKAAPAAEPVKLTPADADPFRRGMDLALDMLRAGESLNDPDVASCRRIDRGGRPQVRFAERHLRELVSAPSQLEGFAAVLSAAITLNLAGEGSDACVYGWLDVAQAEYQPGRPGDDGTVPDDGWVDAAPDAQPAAAPLGSDWREKVVHLLREVKRSLEQAGDELSFVQPLGSAVQSASSLAKFMALGIEAALECDPGPKWLEMLQEQSAELEGLCSLVDVLQGLAASRKGRQGFGGLSEAFQLAQTADAIFDAVVDDLPGRRSPAEPVAAPAPSEATAPGHTPHAVVAEPVAIPDETCEQYMQDLEAAVRVAALETDSTVAFPAAEAFYMVLDHLLPALRSRIAALDFGRAVLVTTEASTDAAGVVFSAQALLIMAANVRGGRPDLARIALQRLQYLANHAIPDWVDGEAPDPSEWIAAAAIPAAAVAAPSGTDMECELDRARVLLDILIDFAVNRADDDPLYVQERTIALASETRRHVVRANGGEA